MEISQYPIRSAVYSRSKAYEEFLLQEWEEDAVRSEDMPVSQEG